MRTKTKKIRVTYKLRQGQIRENMVVTVMNGSLTSAIGRPYVVTAISLPFVHIRSLKHIKVTEIINTDKEDLGRINLRFAKETAFNIYAGDGYEHAAWKKAWRERTVRDKKGKFVRGLF